MPEDIELSAGTVLQAKMTGKTYKIQSIDEDENEVHVEGLLPLPLNELKKDIGKDKIKVLS